MNLRLFGVLATVAMVASAPGNGEERSRVDQLLDAWEKARVEVKDLTACFVRTQQTQLMRKPLVSKGTLVWSSHGFRWRSEEPEPSDMVIMGRTIEIYYPELKTLERYRLRERDMILTALPGLSTSVRELRDNYEISVEGEGSDERRQADSNQQPNKGDAAEAASTEENPSFVVFKLLPKPKRLRNYIRSIRIWADDQHFLPNRVEYVEWEGDVITIELSEIKRNVGIGPDSFKLDLPRDVEIVEPLEDLE
ncbi:MAG: outer membrane lipoprotein carrier protein LolA [Phycisphaerales bacterium]|nr:MAG: outer membrane lipoprotein carrier protein LolA [Phycisphaerales bacterium]